MPRFRSFFPVKLKFIIVLIVGSVTIVIKKIADGRKRRLLALKDSNAAHMKLTADFPHKNFKLLPSVATWLHYPRQHVQGDRCLPRLLDHTSTRSLVCVNEKQRMLNTVFRTNVQKASHVPVQIWPRSKHLNVGYEDNNYATTLARTASRDAIDSANSSNPVSINDFKSRQNKTDSLVSTEVGLSRSSSSASTIGKVEQKKRGPRASFRAALDSSIQARKALLADRLQLAELLNELLVLGSKKALIVTDLVLIRVGALKPLALALCQCKIDFVFYCGCKPTVCRDLEDCGCPTCPNALSGTKAAELHSCDVVISAGGGSPNECATTIALTTPSKGRHLSHLPLVSLPRQQVRC